MQWVRFDTTTPSNPKVLGLLDEGARGFRAWAVYTFALAYSGAHEYAGFIPKAAQRLIHATARDIDLLLAHGFLEAAEGGWQIHDWDAYQLTSAEMQARRDNAKRAARIRWAGRAINEA